MISSIFLSLLTLSNPVLLDEQQLMRQLAEWRNQQALAIGELRLCAEPPVDSPCQPLQPQRLTRGQAVYVYFEPQNVSQSVLEAGYRSELSQSLSLYDQAGRALWSRPQLLRWEDSQAQPRLEYRGVNRIDTAGLPAGEYRIEVSLSDGIKNQSISQSLQLEVREAE